MKTFEYAAPRTEAEVLEVLSDRPGAIEVLAGGSDLVPLMSKMIVSPDRVVNVMGVESMRQIEPQSDGGLSIGAAVTLDDLLASPAIHDYPAVAHAILGINSMQLRAQGTLGGELCQRPRCWFFRSGHGLLGEGGKLPSEGDNRFHAIFGNASAAKFVSSSRLAPGLIALGASVRALGPSPDNEKTVPLAEFYRTPRHEGQREHVLAPGQFITHILLPAPEGLASATYEVRHGEGPDYPLAAAAAVLRLAGNVVREARIVLGQVAPIPWVSEEASHRLVGLAVTPATAEAAGEAAVASATPLSHNGYKVQLAKVSVKRAILRAAGLDTGGF
jgi:xanthine dehydrogenase YagS FAD-binding subunit